MQIIKIKIHLFEFTLIKRLQLLLRGDVGIWTAGMERGAEQVDCSEGSDGGNLYWEYNIVIDKDKLIGKQRVVQVKDRPVRPDNQVLQLQNIKRQGHVHILNHLNEKNWWP